MKLPLFFILTGMVTILFAGVALKKKSVENPYKCALGLEDHKPEGQLQLSGDDYLTGTPVWALAVDKDGNIIEPLDTIPPKKKGNDVGMSTKPNGTFLISGGGSGTVDTIPPELFNTPYMEDRGINPKGWAEGTPLILGGGCGDLQKQIDSLKIEVRKAKYIINLIDSIQNIHLRDSVRRSK